MKSVVSYVLLLSLLSGCASQMQQAAQQDRDTFLQCKTNNPSNWGERCSAELQMYQSTSAAAEADSQQRADRARAVASGLLTGLVVGAAAYSASRPVYVQPVYVVPCRWNCW
jgi:hypothetical protein